MFVAVMLRSSYEIVMHSTTVLRSLLLFCVALAFPYKATSGVDNADYTVITGIDNISVKVNYPYQVWGNHTTFEYGTTSALGSTLTTYTETLEYFYELVSQVNHTYVIRNLDPGTTMWFRIRVIDNVFPQNSSVNFVLGPMPATTVPKFIAYGGGLASDPSGGVSMTPNVLGPTSWTSDNVLLLDVQRWTQTFRITGTSAMKLSIVVAFDAVTSGSTQFDTSDLVVLHRGESLPPETFKRVWAATRRGKSNSYVEFEIPAGAITDGQITIGRSEYWKVVRVPEDASTLAAACARGENTAIILKQGVYNERVVVNTNTLIGTNFSLTGNVADRGGVIIDASGGDGGQAITTSAYGRLTLQDLYIQKSSGYGGGAVGINSAFNNTGLTIDRCTFIDCNAVASGGAIVVASGALSITNSTFDNCSVRGDLDANNTSDTYGGAVFANALSSVKIDNCSFFNCSAHGGGVPVYIPNEDVYRGAQGNGGAVDVSNTNAVTISNSVFSNDTATGYGGAINADGGVGSFESLNNTFISCVGLNKSVVASLVAPISKPGEAVQEADTVTTIGPAGGAIYIGGSIQPLLIHNSVLVEDSTQAVVIATTIPARIIGSILWTESPATTPVLINRSASLVYIAWSNLATHSSPNISHASISASPQWDKDSSQHLVLRATSPCKNTGTPDPNGNGATYETDLDDREPDGTRYDMGALPFSMKYSPRRITTWIDEILVAESNRMSVSPMPVRTSARIACGDRFATTTVDVEIVDTRGVTVFSERNQQTDATGAITLTLPNSLHSGVYAARVTAQSGRTATGMFVRD